MPMARSGVDRSIVSCYFGVTLGCLLQVLSAESDIGGWAMKLIYVCYAAIGFAVARLIFKREPLPLADPVTRFRTSGLL
jgi:hypothetical protein